MPTRKRLKIGNAILCDEIRTEYNNKLIIIGVYTGSILVPSLPLTIRLALFFTIHGLEVGQHQFEVRLSTAESESGISADLEIDDADNPVVIVTPPAPILLSRAGELKADFRVDGGRWTTVLTKSVTAADEEAVPR